MDLAFTQNPVHWTSGSVSHAAITPWPRAGLAPSCTTSGSRVLPVTQITAFPRRIRGVRSHMSALLTGSRLHPWQVLAQSLWFALESKHHLGLLPSPCTAVFDLLTCKLRRLLGPCYKTGREWHCCAKLHCLQHHTPTGGPAARLGHHQSGAATTRPPTPPWRAWALACP